MKKMGSNFNLVPVIVIILVFSNILLAYHFITSEKGEVFKLSTGEISAIATVLSVLALCYQLKKQRDLNEAEFILNLNTIFAENESTKYVYSVLDTNINSTEDPFNPEDIVKITVYLSFFSPICTLVKRKILNYKMVDGFLSYRFFLAINNPYVQKHKLIKNAESFGIIFTFYDNWVNYRLKKGLKEPFEEHSLRNVFPEYKKYMK